jgi:hypothetical protein
MFQLYKRTQLLAKPAVKREQMYGIKLCNPKNGGVLAIYPTPVRRTGINNIFYDNLSWSTINRRPHFRHK